SAIGAPGAGAAAGFGDVEACGAADDGALVAVVLDPLGVGSGSSTVAREHPASNSNTTMSPVRRMPLG
ncbi:MAG: hypothetical protein WBG75_01155, partial [Mycolicibacter algericus]|uniref:hypothetical protein n=1 Tax=Mycolicibacter algericus TaxID=1288388 RepID=UPI003C732E07